MKKNIFLYMGVILLTGCTAARLQFNQGDLHQMVGASQTDVIQKLGRPDKKVINGAVTYLVYTTTYENYTPPVAQTYQDAGSIQNVVGYYTPETCVTVFELKDAIVKNVHTTGACI